MLKNYLRIAIRNLWKQRFFASLNIFGLSLGLAGGLILFQFIRFQLSFDRYYRKDGQLYRLVTQLHLSDGSRVYEQGTPLALAAALQQQSPEVKDQAVLLKVLVFTVGIPGSVSVPGAADKFFTEEGDIAYADRHWFNLFDYTWLEGNPETSLNAPGTAVITQRLALKYFGKEEPVGRTIRLDGKFPVTITGLLKDYPANTDLTTDLFLSRASLEAFYPGYEHTTQNSWGTISSTMQSFVWVPNGSAKEKNASLEKMEAALERLKKAHFDKSVESAYAFHLQTVKDIHFDTRYGGTMQRFLLVTLGIVGLFLVLIACFNFINLATAQSTKRAREVGTRKVLGGTRSGIFWQFMTETACIVLLATGLALCWVRLSLPLVHQWLQSRISFDLLHDRDLAIFLSSLAGIVTLAAGCYPALVLSRWKPVEALKNQVTAAGAVFLRKGLIVGQQVVVQVLIMATLVITLQVHYIKHADPGFNKEAVLMIPIPDKDKGKQSSLQQRLQAIPGIQSVSLCFQAPLSGYNMAGSVSYDSRSWEDFSAHTVLGDAGFRKTFQLQLLAGRDLQPSDTVREFLLNETLIHKFGFKDPRQVIGHRVVAGQLDDHAGIIVGVVKDFNIHPLYAAMEPTLITTQQVRYRYAAIKLGGTDQAQTRAAIQTAWQNVYPDKVFDYHYLNEEIDNYYHKEDLLNKLIDTTAIVAILISCLGLTGLISFFAVQRTKEIGIRKVLGATVSGIVYLLSKDFLKMAALAMLIATPVAWYLMDQWLHNFAYRITIGWWVFAAAGLLSVFIALVTVSWQAIKAGVVNPVNSLRSE